MKIHIKNASFALTLLSLSYQATAKVPSEGPLTRLNVSGSMSADEESTLPAKALRTRFQTARILFPIEYSNQNLQLIPYMRVSMAHHEWEETSADSLRAPQSPKNLIVGSLLTTEFPNQSFKLFAGAFHHNDMKTFGNGSSIGEYYIGGDISQWLSNLWPESPYEISGRITARQRQYPGRKTHLLIPELTLLSQDGYIFSVGIPSHIIFGRYLNQGSRYVAGEVEISSRQFATTLSGRDGWLDGYAVAAFAHWREKIYEPVHISLRAGANYEVYSFYDLQGERRGQFLGKPAPYGSISLTTLF